MNRWGISALLLACALAQGQGQEIRGKVRDYIYRPLQGAKICLMGFADRCAVSDDSGSWSLTIPAGVRRKPIRDAKQGLFQLTLGRRSLSMSSPSPTPMHLLWLDASGRALPFLPTRLAGSLLLGEEQLSRLPEGIIVVRARNRSEESSASFVHLRGEPLEMRRAEVAALAKAMPDLPYLLEATKAGYETEYRNAESPELIWISMRPEGEIRHRRSNTLSAQVLSIDREQKLIELSAINIRCDGGKRIEQTNTAKSPYHIHEGKFYERRDGGCRANRYTGNGTDIVGTWIMDELDTEMPAPFRPATCPLGLPFSRPIKPGNTVTLRISQTEYSAEYAGDFCLSVDRWTPLQNNLLSDNSTRLIENTCTRTAWVTASGDSAFQVFQPHGGRDSAKVTFTYKGKTCSYIDDGLFSDPPPSCPDPVEVALETYLECIRNSGFAAVPAAMTAGPSPRKAGAKAQIPQIGTF